MAKPATKRPKFRLTNIINTLRGDIDFTQPSTDLVAPAAYGTSELISNDHKRKILSGALTSIERTRRHSTNSGTILGLVQSSLSKVGADRLENRKILQLMPEVDKAARLIVASIFSPNDLSRQSISVTFDSDGLSESVVDDLQKMATNFFQKKMNLKTAAPSWVYQYGYETGAAVFAVIPIESLDKINDSDFLGAEDFATKVIDPLCQDSLFGFGDTVSRVNTKSTALESLVVNVLGSSRVENKVLDKSRAETLSGDLIQKFIGTEALSLTDNPAVLQASTVTASKRKKANLNKLKSRYKVPTAEPMVSISSDQESDKGKRKVSGNPILMRLPPESVTVIHTPGDPNDHQGYLILLDMSGNPINGVAQQESEAALLTGNNQNNIFTQVYNAYGVAPASSGRATQEVMEQVYSEVVSSHLRERLSKAGHHQVELGNVTAMYRCMFSRLLQQKQTRILFLPKDLVTYMTFEKDPHGYGVSRLDRIKFNLSMKMAIQVSRVMASIRAAMDKRKIDVKFDADFMEQPEAVFGDIVREYTNKSTMTFSVDPNVIQNQIINKALSIKATGIAGMEDFDITNEPDSRSSTFDFDGGILDYIDKAIYNGLHVPPATMNSLGEDEYARSVVTTNLFFSMDISIDQDITIENISDLIQKYARFSEEFYTEVAAIIPQFKQIKSNSSTDDSDATINKDDSVTIPEGYTLDRLIDGMRISLPKPNVAPSKAQFESLEAMITTITSMMNSLFSDELVGSNDALRPVLQQLRAKFTAQNIRTYLASSGLSEFRIPDDNFSEDLSSINQLINGLSNISEMMKDKASSEKTPDSSEDVSADTGLKGY